MSGMNFLKMGSLAGISALACAATSFAAPSAPVKASTGGITAEDVKTTVSRPNIVLIYADDMGWGDVGYHGYKDVLTPNIDKLAASGTQFSQGYVSASVCGPSRCGLLSGVYQQRMGCGENPSMSGWPNPKPRFLKAGLPASQAMLSEMLKKKGYHCGVLGKWHLGMHETLVPNSRGFDYFYGFLNGAHSYTEAKPHFGRNKGKWPLFRNTKMEPPYKGYLTDTLSDEAVSYIKQNKNKPFFLYVAYNAVHHPWQVPDKYLERTKHLSDSKDRRFFAGMILAMDDGVGRIVKTLKDAGVYDNTMIWFISDNGSPRGQGLKHTRKNPRQERCTKVIMSNPGPFRGFKGDTFEGGIRIPFLVSWPGHIKAGVKYTKPVSTLDVTPTIMAYLGVKKPYKGFAFDGVDLMPYLTGKKSGRPHNIMYWRRDSDYAIRKGDWKLAWNDASCPRGSGTMLFDLSKDPGEYHDLSKKYPEKAKELQDDFDAWDSKLPDSKWWGGPKNRKRATQ